MGAEIASWEKEKKLKGHTGWWANPEALVQSDGLKD